MTKNIYEFLNGRWIFKRNSGYYRINIDINRRIIVQSELKHMLDYSYNGVQDFLKEHSYDLKLIGDIRESFPEYLI